MEDLGSENKAREIIIKNKELLDQKKYYEFGQKVKLITHRKIQGKRYEEAEKILIVVIEHIAKIKEVEDNICIELLQILTDLYKSHIQMLTETAQIKLLEVLKIRGLTNQEVSFLMQLIRAAKKPSKALKLSEAVVQYRIQYKEFAEVERIVADLSSQAALNFVKEWTSQEGLNSADIPAIWARMVLCRAVTFDLREASNFFQNIPNSHQNHPYSKFCRVLLQASQIKSNEAYNLIQKSYREFLQEDFIFRGLYNSIGSKYFGKKIESSGILSIFNS